MNSNESKKSKVLRIVRWVARIWSVASILFVSMFAIGEGLSGTGGTPSPGEWVGIAFFPVGVLIGLVVAWWREGVGGLIAVASLAAFYIWDYVGTGSFPRGPFFALLAAPGAIFLLLRVAGGLRPSAAPARAGERSAVSA